MMGAAASVQPSTVVFGECGAGDGSRRGVRHHPRRLPAPAQPALELHAHVLVVACNPEKLARDCDVLLRTHGVAAFAVVDGFPGTPHVECLAHFVRRDDGDASAA